MKIKRRFICILLTITVGMTFMPMTGGVVYAASKPAAPKIISTTGSTSGITISWSKVKKAKKYQVYRATTKNGKYKCQTTTKKRTYTQNVTKATRYYYKVRAVKYVKKGKKTKKKYGKFSKKIEGMTILPAPTDVKTVLGDGSINITWGKVANGAGYQVYRQDGNAGEFRCIGETGSSVTAFADTVELEEGVIYSYKVRAYAIVNGGKIYGSFSPVKGNREAALDQAIAWLGVTESTKEEINPTFKYIIQLYNSNTEECDQLRWYWAKPAYPGNEWSEPHAWCAAFISAVAIQSGNKGVIPIDCFVPRMMAGFTEAQRKGLDYIPTPGDLTFFKWKLSDLNPDHVGMVYNYDKTKKEIQTIEGNTNIQGTYDIDGVYIRTFGEEWEALNVQTYGVPDYAKSGTVVYNEPSASPEPELSAAAESLVTSSEISEAVDAVETEIAAEDSTDMDKIQGLSEYIEEENPAEGSGVDESVFNAFLIYNACEEMGIPACVITAEDENGNPKSYNQIAIDGTIYNAGITGDGISLEKFVPEKVELDK